MNGNKANPALGLISRPFQRLRFYLELLKSSLSLYIGLSAVFGFVAASGVLSAKSLMTGFSIYVLACGCAILNNIQDKEFDRYFERTRNRSLPAGKVQVSHAAMICLFMITAGLTGLGTVAGPSPFLLGVLTLVCYNAVYTPMKKQTLLAVFPGTWCGMLVPLTGWTAGGGVFTDPVILIIMIIFGLWQMSHFFIIVLKNQNPLDCLTNAHDFPGFSKIFSTREIKLQIMIWTSLYALSMLLFLARGAIGHNTFFKIIFFNAVASLLFVVLVVFQKKPAVTAAFAGINLSVLVFMGAGICDKFF